MILLTAICDSVGNLTLESRRHIRYLFHLTKNGPSGRYFLEMDEAAAQRSHSPALQGLGTQYFPKGAGFILNFQEKKKKKEIRNKADMLLVSAG